MRQEIHSERPELITVTPSLWNDLRSDILKIECASFPPSLADNDKDLQKLANSSSGIFLILTLPSPFRAIGYIAADLLEYFADIPGIAADPHFGQRDTIYVESVAVLPAWRGRGFGTALMRKCIQVAVQKGMHRVTAHVHSGSVIRTGFAIKAVKSFRDWYGTGNTFDYVEILMDV